VQKILNLYKSISASGKRPRLLGSNQDQEKYSVNTSRYNQKEKVIGRLKSPAAIQA